MKAVSARRDAQIVVGVDVGGARKGFHAVALREWQFFDKLATCDAAAIVEWCRMLDASIVGVDAPCKWSLTGRRRPCEQQLAGIGMQAFSTPCLAIGQSHPFYRWMLNGADLFSFFAPHYQLFDGRPSHSRPVCFETFPYAVASALAGTVLSAKRKRTDRPRLLRQAGLSTDVLHNIDEVDAALCALTAQYFSAGEFKTYGDAAEGFIVVPMP